MKLMIVVGFGAICMLVHASIAVCIPETLVDCDVPNFVGVIDTSVTSNETPSNSTVYSNFVTALTSMLNATPRTLLVIQATTIAVNTYNTTEYVCSPSAAASSLTILNFTFVDVYDGSINASLALIDLSVTKACSIGLLLLNRSTPVDRPEVIGYEFVVTLNVGTSRTDFIQRLADLLSITTAVFEIITTNTRTFHMLDGNDTFTLRLVGSQTDAIRDRILQLTPAEVDGLGAASIVPATTPAPTLPVTPVSPSDDDTTNIIIIVCSTVGGALVLVLVVVLVYRCVCKQEPSAPLEDDTFVDPRFDQPYDSGNRPMLRKDDNAAGNTPLRGRNNNSSRRVNRGNTDDVPLVPLTMPEAQRLGR